MANEGEERLFITQGSSITLPCHVTGDPEPQVSWTKNGQQIAETDPHYLLGESGSLQIFSANPQDTGTYSCTAINIAGVREKRITLFVQSKSLHIHTAKLAPNIVI